MNYNFDMKVALFLTGISSLGFTLNDYLNLEVDKRNELNTATRKDYPEQFSK